MGKSLIPYGANGSRGRRNGTIIGNRLRHPAFGNINTPYAHFRFRPEQINVQQTIIEPCTAYIYSFRQNERLLKLTGCNTTMQENTSLQILRLPPSDNELNCPPA